MFSGVPIALYVQIFSTLFWSVFIVWSLLFTAYT